VVGIVLGMRYKGKRFTVYQDGDTFSFHIDTGQSGFNLKSRDEAEEAAKKIIDDAGWLQQINDTLMDTEA